VRGAPFRREVHSGRNDTPQRTQPRSHRWVLMSSRARCLRIGINVKQHRSITRRAWRRHQGSTGRSLVRGVCERRTKRRKDGRSISTEKQSGKGGESSGRSAVLGNATMLRAWSRRLSERRTLIAFTRCTRARVRVYAQAGRWGAIFMLRKTPPNLHRTFPWVKVWKGHWFSVWYYHENWPWDLVVPCVIERKV